MKICRTLWVLNLCLITVTNICCLNPVNKCTTEPLLTMFTVRTMHLNRWWISFTVYNNTSWRQNVTDIFDKLDLFFPYGTCVYTLVYVCYVFLWLQSCKEILAKMASHVLYCHLLALVFWTGVSAVILSPWRSHRDLLDSVYWPHLPCSVPILSLSLSY